MKEIEIKSQKEMDELPSSFGEATVIKIKSKEMIAVRRAYNNATVEAYANARVRACDNATVEAYANARVRACDNATVEAWDNARVRACDNARVTACDNATVRACDNARVSLYISSHVVVFSSLVTVEKLLDYSTAVFKGCRENIEEKSDTALAREIPDIHVNHISYEEWLKRGFIYADGILKKIKKKRKQGEIEVFECENNSFVAKKGESFSHGETLKQAIEDLRYKISDRDLSDFESWKNNPDKEIKLDDAIQAYRVITGACEMGVKDFVSRINVPEKLTPNEVIKLTKGYYGNDVFSAFIENG